MTQMFYPEPGDIIVCKNGYKYTCVAKKDYPYIKSYPDYSIFGIKSPSSDHMCWESRHGKAKYNSEFDIAEIEKIVSNPKTYTAGQVVRAVESLGFEIPVTDILIGLKYADDPDYKTFRELKNKFEGV